MSYDLEHKLVSDLTPLLPKLLGNWDKVAQACQVPHGARVVDIVLAVGTENPWSFVPEQRNVLTNLAKLSSAQAYVLGVMWQRRKVTAHKLCSLTWMDYEDILNNYINPFLALGLIRTAQKSYELTNWTQWLPDTVITVEAKLSDWKCAFQQADDNLQRSDFAYVAFPATGLARRPDVQEAAKRKGIGLIEIKPGATPKVVIHARKTRSSRQSERWSFFLQIVIDMIRVAKRWSFSSHNEGAKWLHSTLPLPSPK
jgi:hypothetical protein